MTKNILKNRFSLSLAIRIVVAVLFCVGCGIALWLFSYRSSTPAVKHEILGADTKQSEEKTSKPILEPELPKRLIILPIGVNAVVESIGLTDDGAMDVPKDKENVGWYNKGPRPGEVGSAVIDGHLDWYNNETAVFAKLDQLKKGDILTVEDERGQAFSFRVYTTHEYAADERPAEVFRRNDGRYLNLITCQGAWDQKKKSYSKRLVIFSERVETQ